MRVCIVAFLLVALSCNTVTEADRVRSFIPGDYENIVDDELSRRKVVLRIRHVQENNYTIERLSVVSKKREGVELPIVYDTTHWQAVYDEQQKVLYEQQKGKILLFMPKDNKLMIGASQYQKVN